MTPLIMKLQVAFFEIRWWLSIMVLLHILKQTVKAVVAGKDNIMNNCLSHVLPRKPPLATCTSWNLTPLEVYLTYTELNVPGKSAKLVQD